MNESVFPYCLQELDAQGMPRTEASISTGITLREYYAGRVLPNLAFNSLDNHDHERAAQIAVAYADALIAELNKTKES